MPSGCEEKNNGYHERQKLVHVVASVLVTPRQHRELNLGNGLVSPQATYGTEMMRVGLGLWGIADESTTAATN